MANPTDARSWKKSSNESVELPSGNTALLKRISIDKILRTGILPDNLAQYANTVVEGAKGAPQDHKKKKDAVNQEEINKLLEDEQELEGLLDSFDKITVMAVVEPPVTFHKVEIEDEESGEKTWVEIPDADRSEDVLYTDEVDLMDKVYIFQWCVGGATDLEKFRDEFGASLDAVEHVQDVSGEAV